MPKECMEQNFLMACANELCTSSLVFIRGSCRCWQVLPLLFRRTTRRMYNRGVTQPSVNTLDMQSDDSNLGVPRFYDLLTKVHCVRYGEDETRGNTEETCGRTAETRGNGGESRGNRGETRGNIEETRGSATQGTTTASRAHRRWRFTRSNTLPKLHQEGELAHDEMDASTVRSDGSTLGEVSPDSSFDGSRGGETNTIEFPTTLVTVRTVGNVDVCVAPLLPAALDWLVRDAENAMQRRCAAHPHRHELDALQITYTAPVLQPVKHRRIASYVELHVHRCTIRMIQDGFLHEMPTCSSPDKHTDDAGPSSASADDEPKLGAQSASAKNGDATGASSVGKGARVLPSGASIALLAVRGVRVTQVSNAACIAVHNRFQEVVTSSQVRASISSVHFSLHTSTKVANGSHAIAMVEPEIQRALPWANTCVLLAHIDTITMGVMFELAMDADTSDHTRDQHVFVIDAHIKDVTMQLYPQMTKVMCGIAANWSCASRDLQRTLGTLIDDADIRSRRMLADFLVELNGNVEVDP